MMKRLGSLVAMLLVAGACMLLSGCSEKGRTEYQVISGGGGEHGAVGVGGAIVAETKEGWEFVQMMQLKQGDIVLVFKRQ